ncbi:MAG: glycosyltransferase family 39 protein [Planctomycetota bacterium]
MTGARGTWFLVGFLLALFAGLAAGAAAQLEETADERLLWKSGRSIVNTGEWVVRETTFQGPLPLYGNQLLTRSPAEWSDDGPVFTDELRTRARLGMLPFGLLAGVLVFRLARRLFGDAGGLLALATFALHPLMFGYGALVAVDMAHAAFVLLALDATSSHAADPRWLRRLWVGVALGLAFATKYLALFLGPICALFAAYHAARGARASGRSPARAALATLAVVPVVTVVALHASYGFLAGLGSGDAGGYLSAALQRWIAVPGVGHVLRLLPAPMLEGLDYQLRMGASISVSFFRGAYGAGHPLYHAFGMVAKTPEVVLVAAALAALLGLPRWLGRGAARPVRDTVWLLLIAAAVPFAYLSFVATLQVGIRYVLPLFPLGFVLLGGLAAVPEWERLRRVAPLAPRVLAAGYGLLLLWAALGAWPNGPGYFNRLFGGPGGAWRHYNDSNADWGQMRHSGLAALRAHEPDEPGEPLTEVLRGHGPRLGRLAIYVRFRTPLDPETPGRARHWLDAFEPVDHLGAAWLVYETDADTWRAAAAADPRARADLAVALLGAGRVDEARALVPELPAERRGPVAGLLAQLDAHTADPDAPAPRVGLGAAWLGAGRPDLAAALFDDPAWRAAVGLPAPLRSAGAALEAQALVRLERLEEAIGVLEAGGEALLGDPAALLLLAELYRRAKRADDGARLLEQHLPQLTGEDRVRAGEAIERARKDHDAWRTFTQSLRAS